MVASCPTPHPQGYPTLGEIVAERYELRERLGAGASSTVFLADDLKAGGEVAVKVLSPERSRDPEAARGFAEEVRIARLLQHHNTIKVWDCGTSTSGCRYLVSEYLGGETLAERLARTGPWKPARVVSVAIQVLKSLAEAHRLGIVHRDLKPSNVLVADVAGESDFVKVLDFGACQRSPSPQAPAAAGTAMTPAYAAPEVLVGEPATPAADVYAVGLIMLELLTGDRAVGGRTVWEVLARQVSGSRVTMPDAVAAHPLGAIIAKAVAKPLERRHPDAEALLDELRRASSDPAVSGPFPVVATPPLHSGGRGAAGWWSLFVAISLVIGLGAMALGSGRALTAGGSRAMPAGTGRTAEVSHRSTPKTGWAACSRGDWERCARLASDYRSGRGRPVDAQKALRLWEMACGGGVVGSCLELAARYRLGLDTAPSAHRSLGYLEAACALHDGEACLAAGDGWLHGADVRSDPARARDLLRRACDDGLANGCARLAWLVERGLGIEADPAGAAELYDRACDGEVWLACTMAGRAYHRGASVEPDPARARDLYARACTAGEGGACVGWGALVETEGDTDAAVSHYARACELGEPAGCERLERVAPR